MISPIVFTSNIITGTDRKGIFRSIEVTFESKGCVAEKVFVELSVEK